MSDGQSPEVASLKRVTVFDNLPDALVAKVARLAKGIVLAPGEKLTVLEDPDAPFYLVLEGRVELEQDGKRPNQPVYIMNQGEFFGGDFVLHGKLRLTKVIAREPARLIKLEARVLDALLKQEPALQESLRNSYIMYRRLHTRHFDWVGPDEMVQEIIHEHPVYLIVGLLKTLAILLLALLLMVLAPVTGSVAFTWFLEVIGVAVMVVGIVWGIWQYIDWDNDYYVVTDRRIAWVEQIVGLYDSREEIILSEVRSVEPETTLLGRMLKYADLYVMDNFQRRVVFKHIRGADDVKNAIETLAADAKKKQSQLDRAVVDSAVRSWISPPPAAPPKPAAAAAPPKKVPLFQRVLEYFDFRMRLVQGNTIIYRQHLIFLFAKQAPAFFAGAVILIGTIILLQARLNNTISFPSVLTTLLLGLVGIVVALLWGAFYFEDWRNDMYQITPDRVLVRKKKPFEVDRRSDLALLVEDREEVIGLQHRRATFLGVVFNFGEVTLTVKIPGETQVRQIKDVFDPAQVHQDIFDRIYVKKRKKVQEELVKTSQLKDWFAAYHRTAEDLHRQQNQNLNSPDSGVK